MRVAAFLPTGPATAPSPTVNEDVAGCVRVSLRAGFDQLPGADHVDTSRHRFEVRWIHACWPPAEVVELQTYRYRRNQGLVRMTVRVDLRRPSTGPELRVALAAGRHTSPHPAPRGLVEF